MAVTDALYVAFLIGGTLWLLFLSYRWLADRQFESEISVVTGEVTRETRHSESEVSGTIRGNSQIDSSISTKITRYQEIFLRVPSGKEVRLSFENFDVPCREQHRLTIVGVRRTDGLWSDCAYHNHSTDAGVILSDCIYDALKPQVVTATAFSWGVFAALVAASTQLVSGELLGEDLVKNLMASAVFGLLAALAVALVAWIPVSWITKRRCVTVKREIQHVIARAEHDV